MVLQSCDREPWGVGKLAGAPSFHLESEGNLRVSGQKAKTHWWAGISLFTAKGEKRTDLCWENKTELTDSVKAILCEVAVLTMRDTSLTPEVQTEISTKFNVSCVWENSYILSKAQFRTGWKSRERSSPEKFSLAFCQTQNIEPQAHLLGKWVAFVYWVYQKQCSMNILGISVKNGTGRFSMCLCSEGGDTLWANKLMK